MHKTGVWRYGDLLTPHRAPCDTGRRLLTNEEGPEDCCKPTNPPTYATELEEWPGKAKGTAVRNRKGIWGFLILDSMDYPQAQPRHLCVRPLLCRIYEISVVFQQGMTVSIQFGEAMLSVQFRIRVGIPNLPCTLRIIIVPYVSAFISYKSLKCI